MIHVSHIIEQIRWWRAPAQRTAMIRLFDCPYCGAGLDEPCRRGVAAMFRHHTVRQNRAARAFRCLTGEREQDELRHLRSIAPEVALEQLERQQLYQRLVELGRLETNVISLAGYRRARRAARGA